ncbi:DUF4976 domain-containing protein [Phaeobacter sp. J2-8]|nr:DUF4976 domain-containing protein [Phaeobacter sp. J2-8]
MEAQSLLPALTETDHTPREHVFCEQAGDMVMTGADFITMVREKRWKLVHLLGCEEGQLFDLESDPDEMRNLWDDPDHSAQKARLKDVMLEWLVASNFNTRDRMAAFR